MRRDSHQNQRPPTPRRNGVLLGGSLIGIVALVLVVWIAFRGGRSDTSPPSSPTAAVSSPIPLLPTPDLSAATMIPAGTKASWVAFVQEFEGVPMVLVPAGCFMMGSTRFDNEQPIHEVCFAEPFWIDQYEVSNGQFKAKGGQAGRASNWTDEALPRERITWFEAKAYCESRGGRLPTEAEWEYAARGTESRLYAWGDAFEGRRLNYCDRGCEYPYRDATVDDGYSHTAPVGHYPEGVSWVGAYDLSGNVWEWVSSLYAPYPYQADDGREAPGEEGGRILRGGAWNNGDDSVRAANRLRYAPTNEDLIAGFRCARSYRSP